MNGWLCCALVAVVAVALFLWQRHRERALYARLEAMLDAAIRGHFSEKDFDETTLSAFESRLAQYLQAGADSSRRLAEQRDQIAVLVSDVSHQTKTPVANLRLYSQLLAEEPLSPKARACADTIIAQSDKLDGLIQGLVKSSRLETGLLALHPVETALAPLVASALDQYSARADAKKITLRVTPTTAHALCDAKWTEEALCNLLDNAIKYTPSGGHVWLDVVRYPMFCALRVRDDGPGIPESEQAKIFARFYRAPNVYAQPGVGIGLYLARQIAQGQGGYIKCTSAPGAGSTFALYLPAASERKDNDETC